MGEVAGGVEVGQPQTHRRGDGGAEAVRFFDDGSSAHGDAPDVGEELQPPIARRAAADRVDGLDRAAALGECLEAEGEVEPDPFEHGAHHVLALMVPLDAEEDPARIGRPVG